MRGALRFFLRARASLGPRTVATVYSPQAGKDAWVQELRFRAKTEEDRVKVRTLVT